MSHESCEERKYTWKYKIISTRHCDIQYRTAFAALGEKSLVKQFGDCAAILVIHDIHNTSCKKETRRFWRKFDIRVTMQMHERGQHCLYERKIKMLMPLCWGIPRNFLRSLALADSNFNVYGSFRLRKEHHKWTGSVQLSMTNQARFRYIGPTSVCTISTTRYYTMFQNFLQSDWINMGDVGFQAREQDMELACGLEIVHANRGEKLEKNTWTVEAGVRQIANQPSLRAKWNICFLMESKPRQVSKAKSCSSNFLRSWQTWSRSS